MDRGPAQPTIFWMLRRGPARSITFSKFHGPAWPGRPVNFSKFSARPGLSHFQNTRSGVTHHDFPIDPARPGPPAHDKPWKNDITNDQHSSSSIGHNNQQGEAGINSMFFTNYSTFVPFEDKAKSCAIQDKSAQHDAASASARSQKTPQSGL